jgi:hypothetical protein
MPRPLTYIINAETVEEIQMDLHEAASQARKAIFVLVDPTPSQVDSFVREAQLKVTAVSDLVIMMPSTTEDLEPFDVVFLKHLAMTYKGQEFHPPEVPGQWSSVHPFTPPQQELELTFKFLNCACRRGMLAVVSTGEFIFPQWVINYYDDDLADKYAEEHGKA